MQVDLNDETVSRLVSEALVSRGEPSSSFVGRYCIVRCRDAGVHAGVVASRHGRTVHLTQARRMWKWHSRFTLSEAAACGIDHDRSRIAMEIPEIELLDACEVIPCSPDAEKSLRGAPNG